MSTVWCVHPVGINISAACRWGRIHYVNEQYVYEDELQSTGGALPSQVIERLNCAANEFDPAHDYMLIAGDHLQIVQFVLLLAEKRKAPRVLRWDRQSDGYYSAQLSFASIPVTLTRRPDPCFK